MPQAEGLGVQEKSVLTYHEERDGEVFPALSFHGTKDGANDGAADADEGDHDDEPADGDGLGDGKAAAGL